VISTNMSRKLCSEEPRSVAADDYTVRNAIAEAGVANDPANRPGALPAIRSSREHVLSELGRLAELGRASVLAYTAVAQDYRDAAAEDVCSQRAFSPRFSSASALRIASRSNGHSITAIAPFASTRSRFLVPAPSAAISCVPTVCKPFAESQSVHFRSYVSFILVAPVGAPGHS